MVRTGYEDRARPRASDGQHVPFLVDEFVAAEHEHPARERCVPIQDVAITREPITSPHQGIEVDAKRGGHALRSPEVQAEGTERERQ